MKKADKERVIAEMLKSDEIKGMYDTYIVKTISFEEWVRNMTDYLLREQLPRDISSYILSHPFPQESLDGHFDVSSI